jgi:hypothetical protein
MALKKSVTRTLIREARIPLVRNATLEDGG